MMMYRRSTQLALQAALLLALEPAGTPRRVRELARELEIAGTYLAKVLHGLTRVGLLRAVRGPGGGVQLARPASDVSLWDVLSAIEPVGELERCFLGLEPCSDAHPCSLHEAWAPIRTEILGMLKSKSLREVAEDARIKGLLMPAAAGRRPAA